MDDYEAKREEEQKKEVKRCKRYIEEHLLEDLDPENLAAYMGYSKSTLWRYFKAVGGYSVEQYIRLRRIHYAARLLRDGKTVQHAADKTRFATISGFSRAFSDIFGISPWQFVRDRRKLLVTEPEIMARPKFYIVGYVFEGTGPIDWEEHGAYYIIQDFPFVSKPEWDRIGGGADMIGTWMQKDGKDYYIFGPGVPRVRYVPRLLGSLHVPGGLFARFPVESPENGNTTLICENVQVGWHIFLKEWLPDSDYEQDEARIPYEFYLNNTISLYLPVKPKISPLDDEDGITTE